jgi:peptidoglycan/xylan/chitin deacetylase (PgdA/CDA1 family)
VGALLVALLAGGVLAVAYRQPSTMLLTVQGRQVRLPRMGATVAGALRAAHVVPQDGALYSAGTHTLLNRHFTPATYLVDGAPASAKTKVRGGVRVETSPGRDAVEATAQRQAPALPPPLPSVEHALWYPGVSGKEDQVYGVVSGEVVSRRPIVEPVPPRRELGNVVGLSFDDGPHPLWTPQILEILRSEGVKATFCVVGAVGKKHPELVQAERDAGHAMCDHTQNHAEHLDRASPQKVSDEVEGGFRFLRTTLGTPPPLYRPPGGDLNDTVIAVAQRNGMRVLRWTVDPKDYEKPPAAVILTRILDAVHPGDVILLHDGGGDRSQTVAMLRPLIQQLKARGFAFATPLGPPAP